MQAACKNKLVCNFGMQTGRAGRERAQTAINMQAEGDGEDRGCAGKIRIAPGRPERQTGRDETNLQNPAGKDLQAGMCREQIGIVLGKRSGTRRTGQDPICKMGKRREKLRMRRKRSEQHPTGRGGKRSGEVSGANISSGTSEAGQGAGGNRSRTFRTGAATCNPAPRAGAAPIPEDRLHCGGSTAGRKLFL